MSGKTDLNIVKPSKLGIFARILCLLTLLMLACFVSFTWFSKGLSWLLDSPDYFPFISCPPFQFAVDARSSQGPSCRMVLNYSNALQTAVQQAGLLIVEPNVKAMGLCSLDSLSSPESITCYWDYACTEVCQSVGTLGACPDSSTLSNPADSTSPSSAPQCTIKLGSSEQQLACYSVTVDSFCDLEFQVTPANEITMRGIVGASLIIVLLWTLAEILLYIVEVNLRTELAIGRIEQSRKLDSKIKELRELVEQSWEKLREKQDIESDSEGERRSVVSIGPPVTPSHHVVPSPLARRTMVRSLNIPASPGRSVNSPQRSTAGFSSPLNGMVTNSPSRTEQSNPSERFTSNAWKRRLGRYYKLRNAGKSEFKGKEIARSLGLTVFYFGLIVVTLWIIITVSPQHLASTKGTVLDVLTGQISVWKVHTVLDFVIFADIILDFGLFLIAALVITWPKPPIFTKHLQKKLGVFLGTEQDSPRKPRLDQKVIANSSSYFPGEGDFKIRESSMSSASESSVLSCSLSSSSSESQDTQSLSFVLKQSLAVDCCLMIACHESTLTAEKAKTFAETLRCALRVFPPSHIFVCDNGSSISPIDDTQSVTRAVHVDINYLYVPEGNKTFAFYWCNRYWIPFLEKFGSVPSFKYAVIIDDDVPLPGDLHIPHEHLFQHPEIKAVHFPILATTPDPNNRGLLVKAQSVEYLLSGLQKQLQAKLSRCLSCHGAIAFWERKAMEEVFFDHDTVFHGEDMYMGLCLLRKRDESRVMSAAQSVVPTYAPDSFLMLFRQRVKSWELTSHRKTFTYLREFLAPSSFCHAPSLVLKPYFLQELITICLDWFRVFLLCGLLLRDWLGLVLMTAFFMALMYVQILLFSFIVLRSRKDLRPSFGTVLVFPFYRLTALLFRICALCHNILVYSHNRTGVKIGRREDEIKDIPPTPPCHVVDWFSVWKQPSVGAPSGHNKIRKPISSRKSFVK
jgi:hypothetical protein